MLKFRFISNKESQIYSNLMKMSSMITEGVVALQDEFSSIRRDNKDPIATDVIKIKGYHERIAMLREEILSTLYGEAFLPDFKETIVMLTQSLYSTIKAVKDASRAMSSRTPNEKCIVSLSEGLITYLSLVVEASRRTSDLISAIQIDMEEAIKVGKEIQAMERQGDEIKDSLLQRLYDMEKELDIISILQMKDIILFIDEILDNMEEATLSVELLYATMKA
ncbi:DUF47 domain-containing protein [Sulfuracidifex tepidarius]|uniref:Phosphate transport regulator n=1 Tax=Sulfuracidifex tepidarius TaxID=1294262 RepID=A0A510DVT7_9CREN|nr:DUF47 family protein [Sulfuracidifex tepidarius]BBG24294.1 hypothetical protein IC006_1603 [Sulfuracidifex tepidarius]BBG27051.1 hypothetical protein IC007_1580 [Sulfuracidifex tepidarius]